ncbi:myb family transcription factor PHL5 isoform X1 [Rosa rugosa]|uniref:myb family transcription factor PHL5 isoform X1 n=1 Tax=Rosa rugosa TaxID=74645 RepID=UPI002B40CB26|nr:myb family transcription factor PHL5 isoform X1 [Rosa rugosa]
MNKQKIDCQERIHQHSHGLISDPNFELGSHSSHQLLGLQQQPWNMEVWLQQPTMDQGVSQLQNIGPAKSPSSIMSRFESPASAFYATEICMGFPSHYESQVVGNPNPPQFPSGQSYEESYSMESSEDIRNTLQSIVKSQTNSSQSYKSSEKSNQIPSNHLPGSKLFLHQQMHQDSTSGSVRRPFSLAFKENQEQVSFFSQQAKQSPRTSSGTVSATSGDSSSTSPSLSSKTRIRWNQDLHEKFVECVNRLGGADKATPKAILKMMGLEGLTIFHVKSHLQKYRIAKYLPDSAEGKSEKRANVNVEPQLDVKTGLQIKEALQLQLDVQRQLHEQLEIQRNLQLRIEEQGERLKKMFDQQQKTSDSMLKTPNVDFTCHENGPSDNEIQVSSPEGSGNSHFPS